MPHADPLTLDLGVTLDVNVVRLPRRRCPSCSLRRVLYAVAVWAKDHPAGTSVAKCARCAGFRA